MNKTALTAAFNSLSFRARLHGAMVSSVKKGYAHYVNNNKGYPFLRVEYVRTQTSSYFKVLSKDGAVIPFDTIKTHLRTA